MNVQSDIFQRDSEVLSNVMKLRFNPLVVKKANGALIYDKEGKEYLDFSAGWGVANTGYNHPRIIEAVNRQMNNLSFLSTISAINEESVMLGETLTSLVPGDYKKKVWYGHSGSDANEFIFKMVPMYTGKPKILTFVGSYHGQSMGAYGMSGHPAQSHFIAGGNIVKIPYPYCFRCPFKKEARSCDLFCADYLENYILNYVCSPEQIGAIVIEAVQCDGGDIVPHEGYLKHLSDLCRKHDILLILDEVKIGFGRTGKFFGFENWGIVPDAVIVGKPMGGGQPLSAVVGKVELMDAGNGLHMFTTAGNPVACAAGLETINIIKDEKLEENANIMGNYFLEKLNRLKEKYEVVGDVRGKGLVIGVELVNADGNPTAELAALVSYRSYELGLIYYNAGIFSSVLELTPPLIITKEQVDIAVEIIDRSIEDVLNGRVDKMILETFAGWGI